MSPTATPALAPNPGAAARYQALDGARAIAIILIIIVHCAHTINMNLDNVLYAMLPQNLTWFMMNCWAGVNLFFLLSGFLIMGQLYRMKHSQDLKTDITRFWKRRFSRIVPVYYLVVCTYLIQKFVNSENGAAEKLDIARNYFFHFIFMNDSYPTILYLWSIATEMKFYLLAPIFIIAIRKLATHSLLSLIAMLLGLLVYIKFAVYNATGGETDEMSFFYNVRIPFYMAIDGLIMGLLCQALWMTEKLRHIIQHKIMANILLYGGLISVIGLMAFNIPYYEPSHLGYTFFNHVWFSALLNLSFGFIILGLIGQAHGAILFEGRILRFIAMISYSIYLVHPLVMPYTFKLSIIFFPSPADTPWLLLCFIILTLIMASMVAWVLYQYVEKRFHNFHPIPVRKE